MDSDAHYSPLHLQNAAFGQPPDGLSEVEQMQWKLDHSDLPHELRNKVQHQIDRIQLSLKYGGNLSQLDITEKYIDWVTNIPWTSMTQDILDIKRAKELMDKNHFGLEKIKERILEFLALVIMQKQKNPDKPVRAPVLMFTGLAGTGKTTFAKSLSEALGRKFVRIPFGGLSSATDLRGQSKTSPESEPGLIIKALREVQVRNPIILLDEMDRVSQEARAEVMGVLLELLDPGQNSHFVDNFIDYPVNLNEVLFVCTGNNTTNISTAVLDRIEVIQMPAYTDEEKIAIGKTYILPQLMKDSNLTEEQLIIDEKLWPVMVRPLGYEPGIRSLQRMIENIVRKVTYKIVSGEGKTFYISEGNYKEFSGI